MAVSATPSLPQNPKNGHALIANADGTTLKTAYSGASNGSKVVAIIATNTDVNAYTLQVGITRGGQFYLLGTGDVGPGAGNSSSAAGVDVLAFITGLPEDSDGNKYIFLNDASDTLQVNVTSAVTVATNVIVTAFGADW